MDKIIEELYHQNANILAFHSGGKDQWIVKIKEAYEMLGDTIRNRKTNAGTSREEFEKVALSFARPFLSIKSTGRYVPDIIDSRDDQTRVAHTKEVEKVVMDIFKRLNLAFVNENLQKTDLRVTLAGEIAQRYMFEGVKPSGEMVFRRLINGAFGPALDPAELILNLVHPFLDHPRTLQNQTENRLAVEEETRKRLRFGDRLTLRQELILKDEVERAVKENVKTYTARSLPEQTDFDLTMEFGKQALFQFGVSDEKLLTLAELRQKEAYINSKMKKLKEVEPLTTNKPVDIFEKWPGLDTTKNVKGLYLTASQF